MPTPYEMTARIHEVEALAEKHGDLAAACAVAGLPRPTYYRWKKALAAGPKEQGRTGRPPAVELTPAEILCLRWFRAHGESDPDAIHAFARHDTAGAGTPPCPHPPPREEVRRQILSMRNEAAGRGRRWHPPIVLKRHCRITDAEAREMRGERARMGDSLTRQRVQVVMEMDENGAAIPVPMRPGTGFVSDDMSLNQPFTFYCADRQRMAAGRQSLITRDIFGGRWLGGSCIGRKKDAYRVEDIADHFYDVVAFAGMPEFWRIERGPWNNNFFYGAPVRSEWGLPEGYRFGGLNKIMRICPKFSPRGKGEVESGFRLVQRLLLHKSTDIGRTRGEFATAAKLYRKAINGDARAQEYFWSITAAVEGLSRALAEDNATPHLRAGIDGCYHVADVLWSSRRPNPLLPSDAWRFMPIKIAASVRAQCVYASNKHYPMPFQFQVSGAPGLPVLGRGHRVFIAFHPGRPEEGCHIFNAEQGGAANREGFRFEEFIGVAPWVPPVAQEDFTGRAGDYRIQKEASAAVRSEYRSVVPKGTGPGTLRSIARDSAGRDLLEAGGGRLVIETPTGRRVSEARTGLPPVRPTRSRSLLELVDAGRGSLPDESDTPTRAMATAVHDDSDAWDAL